MNYVDSSNILYSKGCEIKSDDKSKFDEAIYIAVNVHVTTGIGDVCDQIDINVSS